MTRRGGGGPTIMKKATTTQERIRAASMALYGWAVAMMIVSSIPGNRLPAVGLWQWDKLAHLFEYAVLACLLNRYLEIRWSIGGRRLWIVTAALGAAYAALDELHQLAIPLRACSWQDVAADCAGVVLGLACMHARFRKAAA